MGDVLPLRRQTCGVGSSVLAADASSPTGNGSLCNRKRYLTPVISSNPH